MRAEIGGGLSRICVRGKCGVLREILEYCPAPGQAGVAEQPGTRARMVISTESKLCDKKLHHGQW